MPARLHAMTFYGFASEGCPWAGADDHDPTEDGSARLARRLAGSDHTAADVAGVEVGCAPEVRRPWWIAVEASVVTGTDARSAGAAHGFLPDPSWDARLRAWCEVLGIPWRPPSWCTVPFVA